ncbi:MULTISPECIES: hypothetical protein [Brucella/Ochrobactrum group]|uniref:hypothetical protein n=1 Tax=Brucella/Ochrobactrum group TaxID=2826938 RepID=UPI000D7077A5|nr:MULTISPECIES: hypothetical protein [Brucella/Ochrobactrum group]MCH4539277.1 hypothetical protein [Ochrobactrum sp. A-1]PWU70679.1 hypothetical protein DK867_23505 [Ochrobactrum sp. POC9]
MILALIPNWLKYSLAALVAAFLLLAGGYAAGTIKERQRAAVAAAEATAKAIQKRANIDEKIIGMDAVALCLELGGLRDECEQLRRVEADKP